VGKTPGLKEANNIWNILSQGSITSKFHIEYPNWRRSSLCVILCLAGISTGSTIVRKVISYTTRLPPSGETLELRTMGPLLFKQVVQNQMKRMNAGGAPPVQWGSASELAVADLEKLSRSKLKRHLEARNESTTGNKRQLVERLNASLEEERLRVVALEEELESKHRKVADLEEMGAVYVVGSNHKGQLGLGDLDHREVFTVIPVTRGLGMHHVSSNENMTFAVAKNHRVYTWGAGVGPMGLKRKERSKFESPQLIDALEGEEILKTSVGASHAVAISDGGDCFVWGSGKCGALGLGNFDNHETPVLLNSIRSSDEIQHIDSGESHTCALTREGEVYTWGYAASGRLGLGSRDRNGVPKEEKKHFPVPSIVNFPRKLPVRMISCGPEHSLALTDSKVFSWGAGDSGKLGHADFQDRWEPCEISALNGWHVMDISCGTWHSACVVVIPPMAEAGWVYTWVSSRQWGSNLASLTCTICVC